VYGALPLLNLWIIMLYCFILADRVLGILRWWFMTEKYFWALFYTHNNVDAMVQTVVATGRDG